MIVHIQFWRILENVQVSAKWVTSWMVFEEMQENENINMQRIWDAVFVMKSLHHFLN